MMAFRRYASLGLSVRTGGHESVAKSVPAGRCSRVRRGGRARRAPGQPDTVRSEASETDPRLPGTRSHSQRTRPGRAGLHESRSAAGPAAAAAGAAARPAASSSGGPGATFGI